ncbi:MAG: hypothetical protein HYT72_02975 [Candidatus Aenigmarchaeota archaeon]|nr:hypothetical protein [Candidatus Aenigmarchaeota archaeon]
MPKPARHARVPQRIRVTGSRPFQRRPDVYQQVTEAAAGLVLGPALGAYRQLRDEPLIAVTEVQKRLFVNHTAEKRTTLGELARRHNYAEVEMALLIFGCLHRSIDRWHHCILPTKFFTPRTTSPRLVVSLV